VIAKVYNAFGLVAKSIVSKDVAFVVVMEMEMFDKELMIMK